MPSMAKIPQVIKLEESGDESTAEVFEIRDEDVRKVVICDANIILHFAVPKENPCTLTHKHMHT